MTCSQPFTLSTWLSLQKWPAKGFGKRETKRRRGEDHAKSAELRAEAQGRGKIKN